MGMKNIPFPSLAFFQTLQTLMRQEVPRFRRLGFIDTTFGVHVVGPDRQEWRYQLAFEVFDCREVGKLNNDFVEVKNFMATQAVDEARHTEVFRKRALTTGHGLMKASPQNELGLKLIRDSDSFAEMSLALHLAAEGFVLTLFRFSEYISPTEADKKMFRLVMQDEARMVAYGSGHLRYHLAHQPHQAAFLHGYLDTTEHCLLGLMGSLECLEPLIILSGGGTAPEQVPVGSRRVMRFLTCTVAEYLERCERAGLSGRTERSRLPHYLKQLGL